MLGKFFSAALGALLVAAPSVHADSDDNRLGSHHEIKHVLLISVDGLHALDLANFINSHPDSTLAALNRHGVTYTNNVTS